MRSMGELEGGRFKCLGEEKMKTDTGREVASHQVPALGGGVGPSAGCPIASGEEQ